MVGFYLDLVFFWTKNTTLYDVTDLDNSTQSDSEFQSPSTTGEAQAGEIKTLRFICFINIHAVKSEML